MAAPSIDETISPVGSTPFQDRQAVGITDCRGQPHLGEQSMKKIAKEIEYFREMLNEKRCADRNERLYYFKSIIAFSIGVLLGHFLGLLLF